MVTFSEIVATTCCQHRTQDCHEKLVAATCNRLRRAGEAVPLSYKSCTYSECDIMINIQPRYTSCLDLHLNNPSAPSGSYQIELSNCTLVNVYCDMEGTNCGGEGGWTRVAFVNMSQPNATCPTGLTQIQESNLTLCSRDDTNLVQSAVFTTLGLSYSAVCGRLRGYQFRGTAGFRPFNDGREINRVALSIDDAYVDGVSITHGSSPRKHIWTYAVGGRESDNSNADCPCNTGTSTSQNRPPFYVGDNYYCESGTNDISPGILYSNDPLWDGMNCNNRETPCCSSSNLPWFNTTLPETTTNDDLELRLIFSSTRNNVGGPLDLIELYIR